jgi:hypothetical protein
MLKVLSSTSIEVSGLPYGRKFYWYILTYNSGADKDKQFGPESEVREFVTIAQPDAANEPSPANGATVQKENLVLKWIDSNTDPNHYADTAAGYDVYFGVETNPPKMTSNFPITTNSWTPPNVEYATRYFWRVCSIGSLTAEEVDSPLWYFTTDAKVGAPAKVNLKSPQLNETLDPAKVELVWESSSQATGYKLFLAENTADLYKNNYVEVTSTNFSTILDPGKSYYWRVVAYNSVGDAISSDPSRFDTTPEEKKNSGGGGCTGP